MTRVKPLHPAVLATVLVLPCVGLGLPGCSEHEGGQRSGPAEPVPRVTREGGLNSDRRADARLQVELAGTDELERPDRTSLVAAARRFAVTFTSWLYGGRREVTVAPIAAELRAHLASAAPYVSPEQTGSRGGRAVRVQVFLQTKRSGLLVVSIRDPVTSYPMPAHFERRAGGWQVVHLNTH